MSDKEEAEDVLQETWLTILRRPQREASEGKRMAWLRQVVANLARNRKRSMRRQEQRERATARPEATDGRSADSAAAARARVLQGVTQAVLELPEPYRSTVLLRYFVNLPPRVIASRHGVSVSTVKSRLQRAMPQLREHMSTTMDADDEPWTRQLAMLMGLPLGVIPCAGPPPGAQLGSADIKGALIPLTLMTLKLKVIGLAAGAGLIAFLLHLQSPVALDPSLAPGLAVQGDSANMQAALTGPTLGDERDAMLAAVEGSAAAGQSTAKRAQGSRFTLAGQVFNSQDRPAEGVQLLLAPAGHPVNRVGRTDDEGRFELTWWGHGDSMQMVLGIGGGGRLHPSPCSAPAACTRGFTRRGRARARAIAICA